RPAHFARSLVELVHDLLVEQGHRGDGIVAVQCIVVGTQRRERERLRRRAIHAAHDRCPANSAPTASRSTLPPDSTAPTRIPAKRSRWRINAANTVAEDGSTTCFSRDHNRRIA